MHFSDIYIKTITEIRDTTTKALSTLTDQALGRAMLDIHQKLKNTGDEEKLLIARPRVLERFNNYLLTDFNDLLTTGRIQKLHRPPPKKLRLLDKKILETDVALTGMATHARNSEVNEYLRFTIRINAQFYNVRLDESNNPLDPGRLGEGFRYALLPVNLSGPGLMAVYRQFNSQVFQQMGEVMRGANTLLKKTGIAPNLETLGRTRGSVAKRRGHRRGKAVTDSGLPHAAAMGEQPGDFLTQPLMLLRDKLRRSNAVDGSTDNTEDKDSGQPAVDSKTGRPSRVLDRVQLLLLCDRVALPDMANAGSAINATADANSYVHALLEQSVHSGELAILDQECLDIIALVDLLFDAIDKDTSLPAGPKALLGQTRIPVLRVALSEPAFFNDSEYSLRILLNELAAAGIGWTETDQLDDDKYYSRVREAIQTLIREYDGDPDLVESLLEELIDFKEYLHRKEALLRDRMRNGAGSRDRLEEIRNYAGRKIADRILTTKLPPLVTELLDTHYQHFLVKMIIRDGPDGDSWEALIDTIDVLLWSVAPDKNEEDIARLERISETLMANLRRAFQIAGVTANESEDLLEQLRQLQNETVSIALDSFSSLTPDEDIQKHPESADASANHDLATKAEENLLIVRKLKNDMWFEFGDKGSKALRCKLASRIPGIDRYIFVNRRGVKVLERTESALASDMRSSQARLLNDGRLLDRAIETIFTDLSCDDEVIAPRVRSRQDS